ncbi:MULTISPECIES: tetratricopeptide repeat protein [Brenneria]|uniref:Sel1 repeat family protein n=1 Tax=Brenneria nigrifluens DSM 30175 = ATCC 13028 TaxID=1121120 RepID=A0A2U1UKD0_9GAMM|nr:MULTISPECIES: tetratricopeptide repeat protein [Brenneria]PWC22097.1 sel1 repeat family protein [Brenneria nigrifluens DSM 30175 = ATCC 13028]QCR03619.1 sel1 repeat family protein [Brenneria nigrifluens DSM 30175 = ATCC 13028]
MMKYEKLLAALSVCWLASCQTPLSSMSEAELLNAANRGNGEAQYQLANQLAARSQYADAMRWMRQAAERSQPAAKRETRAAAALQVGDWYQAGLGEPKNGPQARRWWTLSSRLGNGEAGYRLGMDCQARNQGKLAAECIDAFETAASNDYAPAQLVVAQWHATRSGGEADAVAWLQKAADQGNRDAQYQLALRYEQGKGVVIRRDLAERWYFRAAELGQAKAQLWMAGHEEGKNALDWYQKAALSGDAQAQLWLGKAYQAGEWLAQDEQKARYWLERAAAGGSGEANYLLSLAQTDNERRERYLLQASSAGYIRAQRELGEWLFNRDELSRAREEYAKAAAAGDTESRLAYGEMLRWGQGGKTDNAEALKQYRLAAHAGNLMAQYRMGIMRQDGLGASRNRIHAYAWYSMAATEGMPEAIHARNDLEATMQPDEIKAGQRLAMHWSSGKTE